MPLQAVTALRETGEVEVAPATVDRVAALRRLRTEIARRQAEWRQEEEAARCGTGWPEVDALLGGGFLKGQVSALAAAPGAGATTLIGRAVASAQRRGEACAWVDWHGTLSAPALAALGVDLERLLWVRPPPDEALWSAQLLARSGAFALVVLDWPGGRVAGPAAHRLADAARAGSCALAVVAGEDDVPAAYKARLECVVERGRPLVLVAGRDADVGADAPAPGPIRRVRLWVERSRRGGEASAAVSLAPPPPPGPAPAWRDPPDVSRARPVDGYGDLPVRALAPRLHTRPRSRWREVAGSAQGELRVSRVLPPLNPLVLPPPAPSSAGGGS